MRQLRDLFKALACETRLQMLALLLREKDLCVCDFVEILQISQSKASRHLRQLVQADLLIDRRDAVWVHFSINPKPKDSHLILHQFLPDLLSAHASPELEAQLAAWRKNRPAGAHSCKLPAPETAPTGPHHDERESL